MNWFENWFDSNYYHILYKNRDSGEARLLIDSILNKIKPIKNASFLDLGCGSGRHAIYLNKQGFYVDGLDLSKKSLTQAKQYENKKMQFFQKDMRDLNYQNKYDVIINLFTSFGYFEKESDNRQVFRNISEALKDKGYFIIDFLNSKKIIHNLKHNEIKKIDNITFKISRRHDNKFVYKNIYITDKKNNYTFTEKVRLIKEEEFVNYSKNLHMKLINTFGDYNLNKYEEKLSDRLIMIFQKEKD